MNLEVIDSWSYDRLYRMQILKGHNKGCLDIKVIVDQRLPTQPTTELICMNLNGAVQSSTSKLSTTLTLETISYHYSYGTPSSPQPQNPRKCSKPMFQETV